MSNLSGAADHDVVTVAVSNAQDVGGYTVARTWQSELFDGPIKSITVNTKDTQDTCEHTLFLQASVVIATCNTSCGPKMLQMH